MTYIYKSLKKVLVVWLILQVIFAIVNISNAGIWSDIFTRGDSFIQTGENAINNGEISVGGTDDGSKISIATPDKSKIKKVVNDVYRVLFPLGVAVTVIIGGALGIKFMIASAEEKAKVKESLVPYVAGCIIIYGAFGIWKLAIEIFSAIS